MKDHLDPARSFSKQSLSAIRRVQQAVRFNLLLTDIIHY